MYLLSSEQLSHLASRNSRYPIFGWMAEVRPGDSLFCSVVSFGVLQDTIEALPVEQRAYWRRLYEEAKRDLARSTIDVDIQVVEVWSTLRGLGLRHDDGQEVGADELMVVATAIARGLALVTVHEAYLDRVINVTTLTIVTP